MTKELTEYQKWEDIIMCDFDNGIIYRLKFSGDIVQTGTEYKGYLQFWSKGKWHKNHRYLYQQYYSVILDKNEYVCHIDGNSQNNAIINLEKGTNRYNQQQRDKPKNNTTGEKNISWGRNGKYRVNIQTLGKVRSYGTFPTLQRAIERRDQVLKELNEQGHSFITDYSQNQNRLPKEYVEKNQQLAASSETAKP
jgi:hypothetical protein